LIRIGGVLGGDQKVGHVRGLVPFVGDRHLGLRIGPEPGISAAPPVFGQAPGQTVGEEDREGHQLRRFVGRISEHDPLVARSLLAGKAPVGVNPLGDLR